MINSFKDKFSVNPKEYSKVKKNLVRQGSKYFELTKGGINVLGKNGFQLAKLVNGAGSVDFSPLTKSQFRAFLAGFMKHFYSNFNKRKLFNKRVELNSKSLIRGKNTDFWQTIPIGNYFYCLDLNCAYWQSAHKLGYISDKYFNEYGEGQFQYKSAKRLCFSFLARETKVDYYLRDKLTHTIHCDSTELNNAFENIRNYLQNTIYELTRCVDFEYLEYTIDSITVRTNKVDVVRAKLKEIGLDFKIIQCKKLNDTDYLYGSKLRKFIKT